MKIKRSTVLLVGIALLMTAGVVILETRQPPATEGGTEAESTGRPLFGFDEKDVTALTVNRNGESLAFSKDKDGNWQITQPEVGPAEPGAVAFLLSRLTSDSSLQEVSMAADQQQDFGFTNPAGQVTVTLTDGSTHTLILGGKDFSGNSRYAIADPKTWPLPADSNAIPVQVVSADVANGIDRPLAEWKQAADQTNPNQPNSADSQIAPGTDTSQPAVTPSPTGSETSDPAQTDSPDPDTTSPTATPSPTQTAP